MTIKIYIESLINEGIEVNKIKITNFYNFNQSTILLDASNITIQVEKFTNDIEDLVEFCNSNNEIVARAKAFNSVL
jgi:hypothetical protein